MSGFCRKIPVGGRKGGVERGQGAFTDIPVRFRFGEGFDREWLFDRILECSSNIVRFS